MLVTGASGMPGSLAAMIVEAVENGPHPKMLRALTRNMYQDPFTM